MDFKEDVELEYTNLEMPEEETQSEYWRQQIAFYRAALKQEKTSVFQL